TQRRRAPRRRLVVRRSRAELGNRRDGSAPRNTTAPATMSFAYLVERVPRADQEAAGLRRSLPARCGPGVVPALLARRQRRGTVRGYRSPEPVSRRVRGACRGQRRRPEPLQFLERERYRGVAPCLLELRAHELGLVRAVLREKALLEPEQQPPVAREPRERLAKYRFGLGRAAV